MLISRPRFPIKQMVLVGWLPGFLKKLFYRLKGYRIGKKVLIGFGSVIVGDNVTIGDYTSIGFLSYIRGKQIRIGNHVKIGATAFIDTPFLEIGEGSKINEQVFVGGLQFPDSRLVIGRNCQIMQMTFINPCRSIAIGDDSGIGGDCLLFGHTSWLSQLEGYPVRFESIEIGNSVSLSWRVFVLPGSKIGDGAVIGANSLVTRDIPPRCLAMGFPARVVMQFPDFPKDLSPEEKAGLFKDMVLEMIRFFQGSGLQCEGSAPDYTIYRIGRRGPAGKKRWRLRVAMGMTDDSPQSRSAPGIDVFLSFKNIPADERRGLDASSTSWFDVENKECSSSTNDLGEDVANFLRRYGIRFFRVRV